MIPTHWFLILSAILFTIGVFVVWEEPERDLSVPRSDTDDNQTYALMVTQGDGAFFVYAPSCKDDQEAVARNNGAKVASGIFATCRFPTSLPASFSPSPYPARTSFPWRAATTWCPSRRL